MADPQSRGVPQPTAAAPYRLAAVSLVIVASALALGVLGYGLSDYDPHAQACLQGGSLGSLPAVCKLPVGSFVLAGVIFFGGLAYAGRVWSRR
jgi:hypothetical protein